MVKSKGEWIHLQGKQLCKIVLLPFRKEVFSSRVDPFVRRVGGGGGEGECRRADRNSQKLSLVKLAGNLPCVFKRIKDIAKMRPKVAPHKGVIMRFYQGVVKRPPDG